MKQSIKKIHHKLKNMSEHQDQNQDQEQYRITEDDLADDHNMNEDYQAHDATGNQLDQTSTTNPQGQEHTQNQTNDNNNDMQTNTNVADDNMNQPNQQTYTIQSTTSPLQAVQHQQVQDHKDNNEMDTTPSTSQGSSARALTIEEKYTVLEIVNEELVEEITRLKTQLQQSSKNTPQKQTQSADTVYGNIMNSPPRPSSTSASTNDAISDLQQRLKIARDDRQHAENSNQHLAMSVQNFMQTNNSLWTIFMDLSRMILASHSTKQLTDRARNHLGLLQTGANYICIRMHIDQIQYQDTNMTLHNLNHDTHQRPLLDSIIATVANIYSILDDFTDGASLPDLPRALKARSQYVRQISTTCTNALHDPSQLPAIYQAMTNLTEVMGKSMIEYQRQH